MDGRIGDPNKGEGFKKYTVDAAGFQNWKGQRNYVHKPAGFMQGKQQCKRKTARWGTKRKKKSGLSFLYWDKPDGVGNQVSREKKKKKGISRKESFGLWKRGGKKTTNLVGILQESKRKVTMVISKNRIRENESSYKKKEN